MIVILFYFVLFVFSRPDYVPKNEPIEIYSFDLEIIFQISCYNSLTNQTKVFLDYSNNWLYSVIHLSSNDPFARFEYYYTYLDNYSITSVRLHTCKVFANTSTGYVESPVIATEFFGWTELYITAYFDFLTESYIWEGMTFTPYQEEN